MPALNAFISKFFNFSWCNVVETVSVLVRRKSPFFNFYFFYLKIYFLTVFLFSKCFLRTFVNYNRISITYLRGAISLCAYQNTIRVLLYSVFYSNRVEKVVLWWTEILYAYKKRKTCFTDTWRHPFTLFCKSKKKDRIRIYNLWIVSV